MTGDLLDVGTAEGFKNGLGSVRNIAASIGWTMVVLSRYENKIRRIQAATFPITGFRYRDRIVDSQRRRLTGRGK